jgi:hypothetical protein
MALAAGSAPYIERAGYYAAGDGGDALYQWECNLDMRGRLPKRWA